MPAISDALYNTFFRRNSAYVASIFAAAFGFSMGFDLATTAWWDSHNRGKQWKDIRYKYLSASTGDE